MNIDEIKTLEITVEILERVEKISRRINSKEENDIIVKNIKDVKDIIKKHAEEAAYNSMSFS